MANQRPPDHLLDLLLGDRPWRKPLKASKPRSAGSPKAAKAPPALKPRHPAKPRKLVNLRGLAKLGKAPKVPRSLINGKPPAKRPARPAGAKRAAVSNGATPVQIGTLEV